MQNLRLFVEHFTNAVAAEFSHDAVPFFLHVAEWRDRYRQGDYPVSLAQCLATCAHK